MTTRRSSMHMPRESGPSRGAATAWRLTAASAVAALLALGACGALPDKPQQARLYDFGPGPVPGAAPAPAPASAALSRQAITLPDFETPGRLEGTQILFRLGYADAQVVRAYSQARWSLPPGQLLRQRLRDGLARQRTVLMPAEATGIGRVQGQMPDVLRVTLDEFSHYFDAPDRSAGLVRLRATLLRNGPGGDRVLAQRSFSVRKPAPTPDAPGGVTALAAATDAVVAELVQWVDQQPR